MFIEYLIIFYINIFIINLTSGQGEDDKSSDMNMLIFETNMTTTIASTTEISTGIIMDYSSNINYLSVINPNMTQMKSLMAMPREWDLIKPTLDFPKISTDEHFKMSTLLQQKNLFIFNFLHQFLIFIQPDIPTGNFFLQF